MARGRPNFQLTNLTVYFTTLRVYCLILGCFRSVKSYVALRSSRVQLRGSRAAADPSASSISNSMSTDQSGNSNRYNNHNCNSHCGRNSTIPKNSSSSSNSNNNANTRNRKAEQTNLFSPPDYCICHVFVNIKRTIYERFVQYLSIEIGKAAADAGVDASVTQVVRHQGICNIRLISLKRFLQIPTQQSCVILKRMQHCFAPPGLRTASALAVSIATKRQQQCQKCSTSGSSSKQQWWAWDWWWRWWCWRWQGCELQWRQSISKTAKLPSQILVLAKCVRVSNVCSEYGSSNGSDSIVAYAGGRRPVHGVPLLHRSLIFLILLSSFWHGSECVHGSVKLSPNTVKTKYGLLRGIVVRSSPLVEAYLGIPYASPPVGSLRFMPPITPSTWKNVRNADRFSTVCPQTVPIPPNGPEALLEVPRARLAQLRRLLPLLNNQSEDCLYLNIYVPYENRRQRRSTSSSTESFDNAKLSTVLLIHGESYEWNSGNPYDGSELAGHGNVVVVTINFRLGIFGFLKTGGKESAQGNFGLMDLVAGLHWLKENLPAFGADPQSITILGHGSGAALANILVVSPVASDLIQRVVLVSGSALSPWAIQKNPLFVKRRVAEQTGCHGDMLYDDLAPCLRTKTIAELLAVKIDHPRFLSGFAPFVDGTVISPKTDPVGELTLPLGSAIVSTSGIELANFPKRDLIFCLTSVESYLDLSAQDLEFGFNETRRDRILRTFVRNNFHYHLNEIFAVLKNEYTDWEKAIRNPLSSRDATLSFLSDGHTASALIKLGYMHSLRGGRSYFLHFKHKTVEEEYPQRTGSVRGEDVPFWLGLPISPLFPHNYTTQEKQISRLMLRYLANFAKTGNPNLSVVQTTPMSASTSRSPAQQHSTRESFTKVKRSSQKFSSINKIANQNTSGLTYLPRAVAAGTEELNLAVLYNQRRSNALRDRRSYYKRHLRSNNESLESKSSSKTNELPFWDAYDVVNQLYLELGSNAEVQSHYRGHKLSMWLNLIPQLHKHSNINDQSMRHHQFPDDINNRDLYEGVVRPQLQIKPTDDEDTVVIKIPKATVSTKIVTNTTSRTNPTNVLIGTATTECGTEYTALSDVSTPPPADNRSVSVDNQKDLATASTGLIGNLEVLRRLGGKQFQSYTTALVATVAVGCFLLTLNILIFAGIYHQREKRARDAKTKEELQDSDTSKNSSMLKLNTVGVLTPGESASSFSGGKTTVVFGEYNCYDEKSKQHRDEKLLVELPPTQATSMLDANWSTAPCSTSTLDLLKTKHHNPLEAGFEQQTISSIEMATYNPLPITAVTVLESGALQGKRNSFVGFSNVGTGPSTSTSHPSNQFDYAVQSSDQMSFKEIEDAVKASTDDIANGVDDDIPEPPPPPRSFQSAHHHQQQQQGGILRPSGSNTVSTSSGKKRVHIQEISV